MSNFLLDTNVVSELRKGSRADQNVIAWIKSTTDSQLHISVLVLGEIRKGIEIARPRDPVKARVIETWLNEVIVAFGPRLLPITEPIADRWGRLSATRPLSPIDSLLAATALTHDLTLVTRNTADFQNLNLQLHNPWEQEN